MTNSQRALVHGLLTFFILVMVVGLVASYVGNDKLGISAIVLGVIGILSLFVVQWRLDHAPQEQQDGE
ncbi:hypothetical protein GS504_24500 [Rhodococcus hoagii]|nr:hypothetical protein [Prescottella equi]NKR30637.1 hypothetical protein [Prescottella equi]NKS56141.1 hypothetical protein [Prescottella equi]NKS60617.1 hypothetical protein [Prescottella equi]NKV45463.1 hypothetical protein [Prescottella equi]